MGGAAMIKIDWPFSVSSRTERGPTCGRYSTGDLGASKAEAWKQIDLPTGLLFEAMSSLTRGSPREALTALHKGWPEGGSRAGRSGPEGQLKATGCISKRQWPLCRQENGEGKEQEAKVDKGICQLSCLPFKELLWNPCPTMSAYILGTRIKTQGHSISKRGWQNRSNCTAPQKRGTALGRRGG